jgi:hypothetical protein
VKKDHPIDPESPDMDDQDRRPAPCDIFAAVGGEYLGVINPFVGW